MDTPELSLEYREAGENYLRALRTIGLEPLGLLWAYDNTEKRFVLVIVTEFVDFKGPLEISKLLFKAYRHSEMFQVVDPLTIRVHSPKQPFTGLLMEAAIRKWIGPVGGGSQNLTEINTSGADDLTVSWRWTYRLNEHKPLKDRQRVNQKWAFFERNVAKLAA